MKILRNIVLSCCVVVVSQMAHSQPIKLIGASGLEIKYRYENDTSLLNLLERWTISSRYEMTYIGRNELPLVPELQNIQGVTFRDAVEKAMDAYKNHNLDVVMFARMDDKNKHLYLTSTTRGEQEKLSRLNTTLEVGFAVNEADKSLMQVLVRWASQAGYHTVINDQPVNLAVFPRHPTKYADYSLVDGTKKFKTKSPLKEAVSQILIMYTGRSLAPFSIFVDDAKKQMSIVSLVK